jgi:hypothetical protein
MPFFDTMALFGPGKVLERGGYLDVINFSAAFTLKMGVGIEQRIVDNLVFLNG